LSGRFRNVREKFEPRGTKTRAEHILDRVSFHAAADMETRSRRRRREADDAFEHNERQPFPSLPQHVIDEICSNLNDPTDLARLRAVSRALCVTVDAMDVELKEYDDFRAASLGFLTMLRHKDARGRLEVKEFLCAAAARSGQLGELKALRANGCPWDEYTCAFAAWGGHLEVLKWLRENECPWDEATCSGAAEGGHLDILKWARENGCPWDERTCVYAAYRGHLEVLQWARAKGCPWDEWTCAYAARAGHLDVLKWACAKGCPWDGTTCEGAAREGHLEVLQWATENGALWRPNLCKFAADRGHHHVMDWIVKNAEAYERDYVLEWYDMYVGDDDGIDQGT
jgi:hypothetical protein